MYYSWLHTQKLLSEAQSMAVINDGGCCQHPSHYCGALGSLRVPPWKLQGVCRARDIPRTTEKEGRSYGKMFWKSEFKKSKGKMEQSCAHWGACPNYRHDSRGYGSYVGTQAQWTKSTALLNRAGPRPAGLPTAWSHWSCWCWSPCWKKGSVWLRSYQRLQVQHSCLWASGCLCWGWGDVLWTEARVDPILGCSA